MDESQTLIEVLALADKEIEAGETVPIEEVVAEFGVWTKRLEPGKGKGARMTKLGKESRLKINSRRLGEGKKKHLESPSGKYVQTLRRSKIPTPKRALSESDLEVFAFATLLP